LITAGEKGKRRRNSTFEREQIQKSNIGNSTDFRFGVRRHHPNFDFQRVRPAHEERYPHPSNISSQDARNAFRNSTNVASAGKYLPASKL
jgi:hypothetical protein